MTDNIQEKEIAAATAEATEQKSTRSAGLKVMTKKDIQAVSKKQLAVKILVQVGLYVFLGLMAIAVIFPFYWMLISSVKTTTEYNASVPTLWPQQFKWDNYAAAFNKDGLNLGRLFLNTCLVGIVSTILSLIVTVLSAFAFARLEFKGKNLLFAAMLATMMIPGELFTITNYITVSNFGWKNTYTVLIVPFLVSVFYIYLLRQNFLQIPNELYLAAKVDGASDFKYLLKVMIPLAAPTLISITILKMMGAWNSYMWPNLVIDDNALQLITVGLRDTFPPKTAYRTIRLRWRQSCWSLYRCFSYLYASANTSCGEYRGAVLKDKKLNL